MDTAAIQSKSLYEEKRKPLIMFVVSVMMLTFLIPDEGRSTPWVAQDGKENLSQRIAENFRVPVEERMVNLDFREAPLRVVLREFSIQAGIRFSIKSEVAAEKRVTYSGDNKKALDALVEILYGTGLTAEVSDNRRVIIIKEQPQLLETEQQETINGRVTDAQTGEALPGVNILVQGTTTGTSTNADGEFELVVPSLDEILVVSYIGYQSLEVPINGSTNLDVSLQPEAILGDELVVIGYGQVRARDLTGATGTVDSEQIQDDPSVNLFDRIQGRISGLTINKTSHAAGSDPEILIRGINSLSASNSPLVVLDGVPYDGNLYEINPSDIESVSVLKDASSTAIYGARGSNGVILINTKSGSRGEISIEYGGRVSIGGMENKLNVLDREGYIRFRQDVNKMMGETNLDPANILNTAELDALNSGTSVDWQDLMSRNSFVGDHQISVSGGAENSLFYISLNHMGQQGAVKGNDYIRTTLQLNGTYYITDWLEFGTNSRFSLEDFGDSEQVDVAEAVRMSPLANVYDDAGNTNMYPMFSDTFFGNPLRGLDYSKEHTERTSIINLNTRITLPFIEGLSFKAQYGNTIKHSHYNRYIPQNSFDGLGTQGSANRNNGLLVNWTFENLLEFQREFDDRHRIELTGLFSRQSRRSDQMNVTGQRFIGDALDFYGIGDGGTLRSSNSLSEWNIVSYMGRLNYVYNNRYYLTFTARTDGYSGFGARNKYGTFPSAALAWNLSEEDFFKNLGSSIDFLKLRFSYGVNGNQAIPPYRTLSQISGGFDYYFDNTASGFYPSTLGNSALAWENTETFNVGTDFELFSSRITGSIDFYVSQSNDLLLERQIPTMTGFNSIWDNVAKTENKGLEVLISPVIMRNRDFSWNADISFSLNRNKIVQLFEDNQDDIGNRWFIGHPVRTNFDYVIEGVWQLDDNIADSHMPDAQPGDYILKDVNNDGILNADDRTIQDNELPNYTLGFSSNFAYRNISLSFFIYTEQGVIRENPLLDLERWYRRSYLDIDYWSLDNPSNTHSAPPPIFNNPYSLGYYEDASFIKLQNVTLAYNVQGAFLERFQIRNLRMFLTGVNLLTISDWSGYDPAVRTTWYPSVRSLTFGVNLSL